jgi:hypothetical protein
MRDRHEPKPGYRFAHPGYACRQSRTRPGGRQTEARRLHCQTAGGYASAFSRRRAPELCLKFRPPTAKGAGKAGCTLHPRSRVPFAHRENAHEHTGQRRHSGFPCAMGYGLFRALPGERLFCLRRQRDTSRQLNASTAAPEPHDFAVRFRHRRQLAPFTSTASHRAFMTWPTPLGWMRRAELWS